MGIQGKTTLRRQSGKVFQNLIYVYMTYPIDSVQRICFKRMSIGIQEYFSLLLSRILKRWTQSKTSYILPYKLNYFMEKSHDIKLNKKVDLHIVIDLHIKSL